LEHGSVAVEGATLRYVTEGTGIPVLVIGSAVYYPRTFSRELRKHCRLMFADLRHFAAADGRLEASRITRETYLEDIEAIRAALGLERFVLLGHSHHGNVALDYAKRHPQRISHLVLIGSPPCDVAYTVGAGERYWEAHASAQRKAILQRNRDALDQGLAALPPEQVFVARYLADAPKYWHDPHYDASSLWDEVPIALDVLQAFRGFFSTYDFGWNSVQLAAPVLAVAGRDDYAVPHVLWDAMPAKPYNLTYRLLEKSGHTPQLEEPAVFDALLVDWLDTPPAL
jgi:proline iminopeptidase